jgi:hypothetical protein
MNLDEIVMRLIGPVQPVGETREDERRLVRMQQLTELVDRLLFEINRAVPAATRREESMRLIGECAQNYLNEVKRA